MRRIAILFSLLILLAPAAALGAVPQWLTLPPTPTLPKPAQSGTAPVNGIKLWYATFGRGEPVILLHGGLANANYWGHQVRALQPRYRVIVMDSRGHGRSTRDERPYGYDLMATDVIGLMDFLKIPKAAIVGWSARHVRFTPDSGHSSVPPQSRQQVSPKVWRYRLLL